MSDSLPGRISEGEAFLHPQFFEILSLVRKRFLTNVLHFTTNGSLLDEAFVAQLASFRPMEINVSLHSSQPKFWAQIFQRPQRLARIALNSLGLLQRYRIALTGTIVPLPKICGWNNIGETFRFLVSAGAKTIILWWPGFSDKTPAGRKKVLECPWEELQDFVGRMQKQFPACPIVLQPNPAELSRLPIRRIMSLTQRGNIKTFGGPFREVLWLTSEAACPAISGLVRRFAKETANRHYVFPVKNRTYGGNIRVAGLLQVDDFLAAGREALKRWPSIDLVLVPRNAFDAFGRDLTKIPAFNLPEALERATWLVSEDGACHPLLGRGFVKPEDDANALFEKAVQRFDGAVRNAEWGKALEQVASFPIPTSVGLLTEQRFRNFLRESASRLREGTLVEKRTLERLDRGQVLCIEEWPTADPSTPLMRCFHFRKMDSSWKIEAIFLSAPDNSIDNGA